ncbi:MAG: Gfo/Idh/MocA family oxidoreductase [Cyanobacteria bacterium]|nr:Gfo/Idh/MocA family oxidoreductase [Cyanobacteriota bacterium]
MSVNLGIIGLGWMGKIHAKFADSNKDCNLVAVCDKDIKKTDELVAKYNVKGYQDYKELLLNKDIEAVIIVTPPNVRYQLIKDCIDAHVHILCEKPLGLSREEVNKIRAIVKKSKSKFMVCFPQRFTVSFQEAKEMIDNGLIGKVNYIRGNFRFSMKKHGDLHGAWVFNRRLGGGLILEASVHLWDAIRFIAGREIKNVIGIARELNIINNAPFEDNFTAIANLEDECIACIDMSGGLPFGTPPDKRYEILGSEGCIYIDEFRHYLTVSTEKGLEYEPGELIKGLTYPEVMWNSNIEGGIKRLQREFIDCIIENREPVPSVEDGARATEITLSIIDSLSSKRLEEVIYGF